ncbi:MAG: hypothetical protein QNL12_03035 [Acidimicrobiia bacterium]|nr:hypothetical protein [Acidimicrobiia bacterium]MDX2466263.1 hypothetical protein [Acidimicrobiia bacterium]
MRVTNKGPDGFDRLLAVLYSTVLVLGLATVAVTLVIYFPAAGGSSVLLP